MLHVVVERPVDVGDLADREPDHRQPVVVKEAAGRVREGQRQLGHIPAIEGRGARDRVRQHQGGEVGAVVAAPAPVGVGEHLAVGRDDAGVAVGERAPIRCPPSAGRASPGASGRPGRRGRRTRPRGARAAGRARSCGRTRAGVRRWRGRSGGRRRATARSRPRSPATNRRRRSRTPSSRFVCARIESSLALEQVERGLAGGHADRDPRRPAVARDRAWPAGRLGGEQLDRARRAPLDRAAPEGRPQLELDGAGAIGPGSGRIAQKPLRKALGPRLSERSGRGIEWAIAGVGWPSRAISKRSSSCPSPFAQAPETNSTFSRSAVAERRSSVQSGRMRCQHGQAAKAARDRIDVRTLCTHSRRIRLV